jgi:1-acyl-sn-glycerol-3-phosphate acyltransferase
VLRFVLQKKQDKYPSLFVMDLLRLIGYVISKAFWFIRYEGLENLPPNTSPPFLIAANHQTYIDPVWICLPMRRRMRFMAYDKAFEWPFVGRLITYLGSFPVSPDISDSLRAMKEALRSLHDGAVLTVFPEGGREFADGQVLPFKTGAVRIAAQAGVPLLPVTVSGGNRIWPREQKYPHLFRRVTVIYHPLIKLPENKKDVDLDVVTEKLRLTIERAEKVITP